MQSSVAQHGGRRMAVAGGWEAITAMEAMAGRLRDAPEIEIG
jgi:hypothetical protein